MVWRNTSLDCLSRIDDARVSALGGGFCTHVGRWTRFACRLFGSLELGVSQLELSKRGSLKSGVLGILPEERHQARRAGRPEEEYTQKVSSWEKKTQRFKHALLGQ
ncbi:hypothetical protein AMECASPLE_013514 [Ameca splendens]|uniref:Uncharacterized protein n=1 Tax=Ameca splendens TaxID=208324 RepID=A0ABV0XEG7_9TELE